MTRYILIEQVRQMRAVAYTRPFEFSRRIFIVDQAQAVHWQASTCCSKCSKSRRRPPPSFWSVERLRTSPHDPLALHPSSFCSRGAGCHFGTSGRRRSISIRRKSCWPRGWRPEAWPGQSFRLRRLRAAPQPWVAWLESLLAGGRSPDGLRLQVAVRCEQSADRASGGF